MRISIVKWICRESELEFARKRDFEALCFDRAKMPVCFGKKKRKLVAGLKGDVRLPIVGLATMMRIVVLLILIITMSSNYFLD